MSEINPNRSNLDFSQCIQRAFNEDLDRIRVDAEISASIIAPPGLEVSIVATDDNIAIRNSNNNNELLINVNGSINSTQSGTWTTGRTWTLSSGTDSVNIGNFPATVAVTQSTSPWVVSGTVTANIGTTGGLALDSTVSGLLTDTELRASPIPISGTVTANAGTGTFLVDGSAHTQPVSGTITANQGTSPWVVSGTVTTSPNVNIHDGSGNSLTSQVNGSQQALDVGINVAGVQIDPRQIRALTSADVVTVNQGTSPWVTSFSAPQHIILDSGTLTTITNPVTVVNSGTFAVQAAQSGTWNINNISGTISLPTGAATFAAQIDKSQFTKITDGTDTALVTAAGELNVLATAQPGVDIGDVTVNNASGASAVNIQDGGNSITIDGAISFTAPQHVILDSGTLSTITNPVTVAQATAASLNATVVGTGTFVVQATLSAETTKVIGTVNAIPVDGVKTTYSASINDLTTSALPTDIVEFKGSSTKTLRITQIIISGTQNTSASRDVFLIKRSSADSGGTSTNAVAIPHDSNNTAATAIIKVYTVNPSGLGTSVGIIRTQRIQLLATNVTTALDKIIWDFGTRPAQALVVRGTSESIVINLNGVTSANDIFDIIIEWTEE